MLSTLLRCAVEWGALDTAPKPRVLKSLAPTFDCLPPHEADALLAAAAGEPKWATVLTIALRAGLRRGEILALQWADIDLDRRVVEVRHSVYRGASGRRRATAAAPCP